MPEERSHDPLTSLLRAGDPAAGDPGPSPAEQSAMRRRILAAGRQRRRLDGWLVPATTVVALLALALGMAWRGPGDDRARPSGTGAATSLARASSAGQQVQFVTESGTLVVWVLQPRSTG